MTTLFYSHPASLDHDTGAMHPESPARFEAVLAALEAPGFAGLERREAPPVAPAQLARVHTEAYVANSTLGTLGALIVGNGLVRPAGSLCTIFGMRKTGEQLSEWSMDLIQEGMRMRFP